MGTYENGWKNARLSYYGGLAYVPIACITNYSETNTPEFIEHTNVCTEGETEKAIKRIARSGTITGEVVSANSYAELLALQLAKTEIYFKREGESRTEYFKAFIEVSSDNPADGNSTFTANLDIQEYYKSVDPKAKA